MVTPTDAQILTLSQWFSPAYPVGAFAYSHGLEWAVEVKDVTDAPSAKEWIAEVVEYGTGWNDCLLLSAAHKAATPDAVQQINDLSLSLSTSRERLLETRLQGEAFSTITTALWPAEIGSLSYPVAVGHASRLLDLPLALTTQFYLHAFMANLAATATRLVPLGQTEGQTIVRDLTPLCQRIATSALAANLDQLTSTSFLGDIAAMKHETQYSRMFRT